ncbi:DUF4153 domain-containing protein [Algoriphagus sp. SE2]|uniref:DUF4153 domain-containing protein n=1 Tax=Algoriphagus sp. SE2 TaxID=3141536 RepID=UPI0031CD4B39
MKFSSINQLREDSFLAAKRFPLSLISAFLGSFLLTYLIEIDEFDQQLSLVNLLLTLALGVPLFFCVDILIEKLKLDFTKRLFGWGIALIILTLIYFSFPEENTFTTTRIPYIRYIIYNLTAHLLVAFLSYWNEKSDLTFWKFNENLFLRIVLATFYSLVIFTGISLALAAIRTLFSVEIEPKTFFEIFIFTVGIFNTWFFLSGVPRNLEERISLKSYPKGFKIFTQFILIPLLLVYLAILYFYGAKIILTWDWPKGIVSYMIIAISVLGIFTNLLLFPIQDQKESTWIKTFYRAFYFLLIPLIVLLFLAIGIRIQDYGLTVNRYIILLMGIWLTLIVCYFTFGPARIKIIPISLAFFMIIGSFGPWGMFSLSESRQVDRLEKILTDSNILLNGKIQNEVFWEISEKGRLISKSPKEINRLSQENLEDVNSIIQYLEDYHGFKAILNWFEQDLKKLYQESSNSSSRFFRLDYGKFIVESMGIKYIPNYLIDNGSINENSISWNAEYDEVKVISGFDFAMDFNFNSGNYEKNWALPGTSEVVVKIDPELGILYFELEENKIEFDISALRSALLNQYGNGFVENIDAEDMALEFSNDSVNIKIQFQFLENDSNEQDFFDHLEGTILFGKITK